MNLVSTEQTWLRAFIAMLCSYR